MALDGWRDGAYDVQVRSLLRAPRVVQGARSPQPFTFTEECRELMTTIAHRHRPAKMSDSPFFGCVALAGQCSPASHGTITRVQTCTCGATRRVNSDGLYAEERGPWTKDG